MREASRRSQTFAWQSLKPLWLPLDVIVLQVNMVVTGCVLYLAPQLALPATYLGLHLSVFVATYLLAKHDEPGTPRTDFVKLVHHWLPAAFILSVYFELGQLIPLLRDYRDYRYDVMLQRLDVWLLGPDPAFTLSKISSAPLSDVLTACYLIYYPVVLAVPAALYIRGALEDYQHVATIIVVAFLISYVGYVVFPALGPHRLFDGVRSPALDGYGFARMNYQWLRDVPNEPPDAFPSGHTLIGVLAAALSFRFYRPLFSWLAPVSAGIVLATVYLRLHYLLDVAVALALVPAAWWLGASIERRIRLGTLAGIYVERGIQAANSAHERLPMDS